MKEIINLFDSELRAMAYVQMELLGMLDKHSPKTKNEFKLKELLKQRLTSMIDACDAMRGVVTKLKALDEFDLLHGADLDELLNGDPSSSFGLRRDREG